MAFVCVYVASSVLAAKEPVWLEVKPLRNLGDRFKGQTVLADIECRMPAGHQYAFPSMPMTWAHETTHGLNSNLRMAEYRKRKGVKVNAFYCLDGKAVVVLEPKGNLRAVAKSLPASLRGPSFSLYLGKQLQWWADTPTYLLDEWIAYTNGSLCGEEVKEDGWHYELLQAINFCVYSLDMARQIHTSDPGYDHEQLRALLRWNTGRVMMIYDRLRKSNPQSKYVVQMDQYLSTLRSAPEAKTLRDFGRTYFGVEVFHELYRFETK